MILLILDLSAAFDTVDNCILLSRLSRRFGIGGRALEWFRLYLGDRTQFVNTNGSTNVKYQIINGSMDINININGSVIVRFKF